MKYLFSYIVLLLALKSCENKNSSNKHENISALMNKIEIPRNNQLLIMLFNDFCDPCIEEIGFLIDYLDSIKINKRKTILFAKNTVYKNRDINKFEFYEIHREVVESVGLAANVNYLVEFDENGIVTNFWELNKETIKEIISFYAQSKS
ncbi:hypothetical protein ACFOUP_17650 [Belliella kenyensis]|uniref:AhpC/TSA family protein n=1 Tax=Belliella kenyensis TaxID=1472724 RepID=A0ABV8ESB6_9BACT|nr:hypothetical protein [Belliella kenyensis]MCH7402535.1 hypothetical protein [Belliella kenyensis]MDN3603333.1 hypothetical protein [Belliella kenyensis]